MIYTNREPVVIENETSEPILLIEGVHPSGVVVGWGAGPDLDDALEELRKAREGHEPGIEWSLVEETWHTVVTKHVRVITPGT